MTSAPPLGRLILYTKRLDEMIAFYSRHFGYTAHTLPGDRITELRPPGPGLALMLHPAGKGQREGQVLVNWSSMSRMWRGSARRRRNGG